MVSKRSAEDETESKVPKNKRHKPTRTDPMSGQRGAFGDLGGATTAPAGDSDLDCEDDSEALAYLRSVRTQASTIPHVLVATKAGPPPPPQAPTRAGEDDEEQPADRTIYENGIGDFRGYYQDGAYVACPDGRWGDCDENEELYEGDYDGDDREQTKSENDNDPDASESDDDRPRNSSADEIRDAYFTSITNRYITLRKLLQTEPPDTALRVLPATNPSEVGEWKRGADTFQKWEGRLRTTDPLPAQIAAMHKDSVFRLIRVILTCKFLRKRAQLRERTSRWIWALLARLPDAGELDYMEVGYVRELGKRAVLMMVSLAELEVLREHYDVAGSSPGDQDEYEVDVDVDECYDDALSQDSPVDIANAPTPEDTREHVEQTIGPRASTPGNGANQKPDTATDTKHEAETTYLQEPSPGDTSDVEMQLDSDMEDGEVADEPPPPRADSVADIETAKAQLLARLSDAVEDDGVKDLDLSSPVPPSAKPTRLDAEAAQTTPDSRIDESEEDERYQALDRDKINERATLNMILTVAGEFYGQRDLLEFRDPFGGLHFE
ncbi:hypothetical protein F5B22DRAFT_34143 [Xylaria bambusicola]|uniref:uncharacterized protein n=1 Tax=Xylaria bambusicola TaxID=326684 RepID=UPI002007CF12|nr:uncharacterized protein F5B22DRAFT_34143 [Xylaria bambusicola]KAI0521016.1 hypothetical protein F5B22DRAFT_34143 [Xylaria bambusicola]